MVQDEIKLIEIFNALGDTTRFKLYTLLVTEDICVGQLAERLKISSACVSQHMKILSDANLIKRVRKGQRVCYQINSLPINNQVVNNLIFKKGVPL